MGDTMQAQVVPHVEDVNFADYVVQVATGAAELYADEVQHIHKLSPHGTQQLLADLEYFCNVLAALGVALPPSLSTWQVLTSMSTPAWLGHWFSMAYHTSILAWVGHWYSIMQHMPESLPFVKRSALAAFQIEGNTCNCASSFCCQLQL